MPSGMGFYRLMITESTEEENTASFIGIVVAISGNVLISLALNCQKLAHRRLENERKEARRKHANPSASTRNGFGTNTAFTSHESILEHPREDGDAYLLEDEEEDEERTQVGSSHQQSPHSDDDESGYGVPFPAQADSAASTIPSTPKSTRFASRSGSYRDRTPGLHLETEPLLAASHASTPRGSLRSPRSKSTPGVLTRLFTTGTRARGLSVNADDLEGSPLASANLSRASVQQTPGSERSVPRIHFAEDDEDGDDDNTDVDYLKSKLWWLGFVLMNVGESGNFISYAFAPASVVAPLGTFALIANCFFAPLMLKEKFRKQDLFGVFLSILGAVTVVLSANTSDKRLTPEALIEAITQQAFLVLTIIYVVGAIVLVSLSSQRAGREHVIVDVGACALFGGFTVLSTKAFSSLLTKEWVAVFKEWITYPVLVVLIGTGVMQIRHLNRALMKFDSKVVIPAQFVFFNISAIVGSAVLYGDFREATLHQMLTFLYGCGATFAGVFMLTWRSAKERRRDREEAVARGNLTRWERTEDERRAQIGTAYGAGLGRPQLVGSQSTPARPMNLVRAKTSSLTLSPAQRALLVRSGTGSSDEENEG